MVQRSINSWPVRPKEDSISLMEKKEGSSFSFAISLGLKTYLPFKSSLSSDAIFLKWTSSSSILYAFR